jgi:hypothetical protein
VDVRPAEVGFRWWRDHPAREVPNRTGGVGWDQTEEVALALSTLDGDVDVVMPARTLGARTATAAWKIKALDADQHMVRSPSGSSS